MKKKISKMDFLTLIMKCLLNRDLEGATDFTSESWTDSNSCTTSWTDCNSCTTSWTDSNSSTTSWTDSNSSTTYEIEPNQCSNTGLLVAVIILAVILLLLVGGAGVAYLRYVRSVFWAHMYLSYHWPSDSSFLQLIVCLVKFLVVSLALWHEKVYEFSNPQLTVFIVQ